MNIENMTSNEKELIEPMIFDSQKTDGTQTAQALSELIILDSSETDSAQTTQILSEPIVLDSSETDSAQTAQILSEPMIFYTKEYVEKNPLGWLLPLDQSLTEQPKIIEEGLPKVLSVVSLNDVIPVKNKYNSQKDEEYDKETAYEIMQKFLIIQPTIIVNENFYIYNSIYYEQISIKQLNRLICKYCDDSIERSGSPRIVDNVSDFINKNPNIIKSEEDISKHTVAFNNGVLDIVSHQLQPHSPQHYNLYALKANYLCTILSTPVFDEFLFGITGGDKILSDRIWEMIGYILTPDTAAKVLFLLQGVPNSGKSVLSALILSLFPNSATTSLDINGFIEKFSLGTISGKAVCISPDLPSDPIKSSVASKIKQITGNDYISVENKYEAIQQIKPFVKLVFATNHALLFRTVDDAFSDRIITIPFQYSIPRGSENTLLLKQLKEERDGIATRAMHAYYQLVSRNYRFSGDYPVNSVVTQRIDNTFNFDDSIQNFVQDNFMTENDAIVFTEDAYSEYVKKIGYISKNEFSHHFKRIVCQNYNATEGRKRRNSKENAISCVIGITWKGGNL